MVNRHRSILAVVSLLFAFTAAADQAKPWTWTTEERAQARLDKAARVARIRAHEAKNARREGREAKTTDAGDVIDGSANPELFFPIELFHRLIVSAFIDLPQIYPRVVQQRSSDLFQSADEWEYFQSVTTKLAEILQRERQLRKLRLRAPAAERTRIDKQIDAAKEEQCSATAAALRTLRSRFGRERFDRMLYEVVAPGHLVSWSGNQFEADVQKLLRNEENCQ